MDHSHLRDSVAGNVFLLWFFYFFIIASLISAVCQPISLKFARICVIYERRSQMQANPKQILTISEVLYKWGKFWIFSCDFFFISASQISAVRQSIWLKFCMLTWSCVIYERRSKMEGNPKQILTINCPWGALQVWEILWTLVHKRRWTIRLNNFGIFAIRVKMANLWKRWVLGLEWKAEGWQMGWWFHR